jgi:hypothetical protein
MNKRKLSMTLVGMLLVFLVSASAFSQVTTGVITGRVQDSSGALIPGVEITVSSPAIIIGGGSRLVISSEQGNYRVTQLPSAAEYTVTFSLPGFRTLNVEGVNVSGGAAVTINAVLEVATVAEAITVMSTAPTIDLEEATTVVNWGKKLMDELPYGRSVRALSRLIPGFTVTHFDVGGNTAGGSASFGAELYGRKGGDEINYDGMNWSGTFGDYGTYSEIQFETSAKGADARTPGVAANHIIKSGSNFLNGTIMMALQDSSFQSANITQELLDRGMRPSDNKFIRYHDLNGDIGGPIIRDKLWVYYAHGNMFTSTNVPGFAYPDTGELQPYTTRLDFTTSKWTYQVTDNQKLEASHQFSRKDTPWRGAATTRHPLSSQHQLSMSGIGPTLKWTNILSPTMTIDLAIQRGGYWWPDTPHTTDIRQVDLNSGYTSGAQVEVYRRPLRWQVPLNFSWFTNLGEANNEIKIGYMTWWGTRTTHTNGYPNQQVYQYESTDAEAAAGIYYNNPDRVEVYDYPNTERYNNYYDTFFINDKITVNRHLTMNLGFRAERYASSLPQQGSGSGPFSSGTRYESRGRDEFPSYSSLVPRMSVIYDITGEGTLALKFSYGKYASESRDARRVNPNQRTRWRYDWAGTIPFVPNKGPDGIFGNGDDPGLQSVSGGGGIGSVRALDPNLDNLTMDEYTAGLEMALGPNYAFRFSTIRKHDKGGYKTVNRALPFSAYTDQRFGVDVGPDNVAGTSDDQQIEIWSVPRSYPGFGKVDQIYQNFDKNEGRDMYTAFDFAFSRRFADGYTFTVTHTSSFAKRRDADPQNPNELLYSFAQQYPEWDHVWKVNGVYELPFGLKYSMTLNMQAGSYYNRTTRIRNALGSKQTVEVDGQVGRYGAVRLWDNRLSKTFQINDRHSMEAMFDMYNTLNSSAVLRHENRNGPNYLKPLATSAIDAAAASPVLSPRIFRLGMRWRF